MTGSAKTGKPLKPDQLVRRFDKSAIGKRAKTGPDQSGSAFGQARALGAIEFSANIMHSDFNLFVLGKSGSGRHKMVMDLFGRRAAEMKIPSDWIYVNNFDAPHKPIAISLPPGSAPKFRNAMQALVDELANDIPARFEADEYQNQRRTIEQEFSEDHEKSFSDLMERTKEKGMMLLRSPMGFMVAATKDNRPMTPDEFKALSQGEQDEIDKSITKAQEELEAVLKQIPKREKEHRTQIEKLNFDVAQRGVEASITDLVSEFGSIEAIAKYLEAVKADFIANADIFLESQPSAHVGAFPVATTKHYEKPEFQRYAVNVIVSNPNGKRDGAPVITENLPTLSNLVGRVEHRSEMGMLTTDFTLIKSGALHRANGGFLILDIRQILSEPFAWDALKRCMKTGEISIVSAQERFGLITTTSLEPDPIPLNMRVALIGERIFYYLLAAYDPDFADLFKVQADFNDEIRIDNQATRQFADMSDSIARHHKLAPLEQEAILRLLSEATRLADDSEKLSLNIGKLSDIIREADYIRSLSKRDQISASDVEEAIQSSDNRADRYRELTHEAINRDILLIQTEGKVVGQINALSVHQIGDTSFGRPSRITARTRMGKGTVVDIEREVELGGPLHSKGVLILSGYLATHYALDVPVSLWASIVFEQSYGGVDGDSASAAELCALLSALSGYPIDQSFAVTGSINQRGEIQAIGGVNQKIEGFFDICLERGLTGNQGVLIPHANVKHLALRPRVVDAVKANTFRIIPFSTINEGLTILTGQKAGVRNKQGNFPNNTVNASVEETLQQYAKNLRKFGKPDLQRGEDDK